MENNENVQNENNEIESNENVSVVENTNVNNKKWNTKIMINFASL